MWKTLEINYTNDEWGAPAYAMIWVDGAVLAKIDQLLLRVQSWSTDCATLISAEFDYHPVFWTNNKGAEEPEFSVNSSCIQVFSNWRFCFIAVLEKNGTEFTVETESIDFGWLSEQEAECLPHRSLK